MPQITRGELILEIQQLKYKNNLLALFLHDITTRRGHDYIANEGTLLGTLYRGKLDSGGYVVFYERDGHSAWIEYLDDAHEKAKNTQDITFRALVVRLIHAREKLLAEVRING